jgi:hypothetical protein
LIDWRNFREPGLGRESIYYLLRAHFALHIQPTNLKWVKLNLKGEVFWGG